MCADTTVLCFVVVAMLLNDKSAVFALGLLGAIGYYGLKAMSRKTVVVVLPSSPPEKLLGIITESSSQAWFRPARTAAACCTTSMCQTCTIDMMHC